MTAAGDESDEAWMARLGAGQDSALNALMERWQIPLRSYLLRYLQNDAQALDIAEEVFVRIYKARERYDARQRFSSWMFAIATNLARNHFRWRTRHPGESIDASGTGCLEGEEALRENSTPADRMALAERAEAVRNAISRLPDGLKSPVLLFEYENLSHIEIARVLGCSAKAVEARLYRARGLLRRSLSRFMTESSRG
jgi:RNA polymerase sigma-70 factor (ECF subfamily)